MKTTTNTRNTGTAQMSQPEEKAMALMLHINNNYFVCNGYIYQGTEDHAKEVYNLYLDTISPDMADEGREPLKSFEEWTEENIEPVDASLDAIEAEGYRVCTESDQEPCKSVIDTQVINNTTYYICKRENATNDADNENTTPSEIEKAIKLLQANDYFVHNKKEDEDVMIVLNVDSNQFPKLFLEEIERLELYTYMDTSRSLEEHLFSMEHLWEEWNEGAFELNDEEKTALERIDAEMREKGCGYFRVIA